MLLKCNYTFLGFLEKEPVNTVVLISECCKKGRLNVEYSKSLRWFYQVSWAEKGCFVDCLVDTSKHDSEGYSLIEEQGQLKLYSYKQLQKLSPHHPFEILGIALRLDSVILIV